MRNSTLKAAKNRIQGLVHSVQFNGNIPIPSSNGTGLCSANGGIVPPVLVEEDRVPRFYQDAITFCGAVGPHQLPNTALVYNLMVTSQLPRDVLGNIWSLVNRTLPGQLTRQEFFSCLALIALAQRGQSLSALCDVTTLPIPHFQTFKANEKPSKSSVHNGKQKHDPSVPSMATKTASVQSDKNNLVNGTTSPSSSSHNTQNNTAAFIPTHLLKNQTNNDGASDAPGMKMPKEQDLLGLFSFSSSSIIDGPSTSSSNSTPPKNDLTEIAELFEFRSTHTEMEVPQKVEENLTVQLHTGNDMHLHENGAPNSLESTSSEPSDPYAALRFTDDTNLSTQVNECVDIWKQISEQACQVINETVERLSQSNELVNEILDTDNGYNFVQSVHAVYHMVERIRTTIRARNIVDHELVVQCEATSSVWEKLLNTEAGRKFLDTQTRRTSPSSYVQLESLKHRCGICLQLLVEEKRRIEFVGRFYHTPCANFWINRINSLLPKLE